uniref:Uncharacterized protein n=1 Tax=Anguilla anguilla TaxID=7936 RepID=A0A0E9V900_ANGAN
MLMISGRVCIVIELKLQHVLCVWQLSELECTVFVPSHEHK